MINFQIFKNQINLYTRVLLFLDPVRGAGFILYVCTILADI